ncbi:hypothetical protein FA10DRAFT_263819 [Acaromyces ingoldii]|uniref:Rieske domain-containing protein n=1 Tax=Acaromyces ingoldii TaxID=215250 RepID=A0A316YVP3_9BASI|nr:hypothetical protein FA10DRAFT_263819 [Acaromyces ingoldii]PWN93116.1 hypothetical protein FA10DRAFT_263819 [Acaromyces ingoldii]
MASRALSPSSAPGPPFLTYLHRPPFLFLMLSAVRRRLLLIPHNRQAPFARPLHSTSIVSMPSQRVKVADASSAPKSGQHKAYTFAGEGDDAVQVLVSNVSGKMYATSAKCTHYGAPLANGVLTGSGKLICPWHGACFDAKSGDIEDAPALDNLLSLKLDIDESNGDVYVEGDPEKLKGKPGQAPTCQKATQKGGKGLVIVGGGSAAINAAESSRKNGYTGPITILSAEKHAPIDRTKLSKGLVSDADAVVWRSPSHLGSVLKVDLKQDTAVTKVDVQAKKVHFGSESVDYDTLILATGGQAKRLPIAGAKEGELKNVFTLRGVGDVGAVLSAAGDKGDKDVVVVGTSFIGMEVAVALAGQKKAKSVKVIGMEEVPFEKVLGKEVGEGLMNAQIKNNGIKFYNQAGVERLEGEGGTVKSVVIKDSKGQEVSLDAQIVVLGVGVAPATSFLKDSPGFPDLLKDGSIAVDEHLRVKGVKDVFACGDIATVPARDPSAGTVRIEHWNVAANHGRSVGALLASKQASPVPFQKLPIFWSALGSQLRYVSDGNPPGFDECYVDGKPEELKFAAFYAKKGKVNAVATMGVDPLMVHSAELMRTDRMPSLESIKKGQDPLSVSLA